MNQNNMLRDVKVRKILVFSTAYYPFVGGAEVAIKEITDRLSGSFAFDLITAKMDGRLPSFEKIGPVSVYRMGSGKPHLDKLLLPFRGGLQALRLSKKYNYFCFWAVMVTFGSGAAYICNIIRSITGRKAVPVVLTLQEGDSEGHLKFKWAGLISLSWKLALRRTASLTALSSFLLHRAEKFGWKGRGQIVPNGVDLNVFSKTISDIEKREIEKKLNKKPGDIFLVTSSRLTKKNAVDDIISSLVHLPKNVSLIVIGKGEEGPRLQSQVRKLKLSDRVKFTGFIPQGDIPKYFSASDIFVRPSRSEGFGNSFIEAMAARLPVIASPVGGIPDFIDDKETGVFCAPDNPKSLAEAVSFLVGDKETAQKIVAKAYNLVQKRYSWSYVAERMKSEVFDKIV
jgi:glycosyltransferase involved in cell wall biosynthesis